MNVSSDRSARVFGVFLVVSSFGIVLLDLEPIVGGLDALLGHAIGGGILALGFLMILDGWGHVSRLGSQLRYALLDRSS